MEEGKIILEGIELNLTTSEEEDLIPKLSFSRKGVAGEDDYVWDSIVSKDGLCVVAMRTSKNMYI